MTTKVRLGIDIGGTFTDAMVSDHDGRVILSLKTPSVPSAPEQAIFNVWKELADRGLDVTDIELFVHGTTLGVNTLIERNGAQVGLLVTTGFRDILEIRRLRLENTTDLYGDKSEPLVPRRLVKEVDERILADGSVYQSLDREQVLRLVDELLQEGVTAIAICYLHSYVNPIHEQQTLEWIREACPELFVCASSQIWPQQREYERCLVTVMNAYIGSRMRDYFRRLKQGAAEHGLTANVLSTMSNGGIMTAERAAEEPVRTLLSGPASGVIGAAHVARTAGFSKVVTFDMGGTSVDVSLIDQEPMYSTENEVGGLPVIIPAIDVTAIGAGGGSLAWVDAAGVLKVGPQSAGAVPGPACYGRGGERPATTDAYLHLGILGPDRFLGGAMRLYPERSAAALEQLGAKLGLSSTAAAQAILDVATANMYAQFTPLMARKGVDPRDYTLIAYGGAGPMHAFLMAREVGIRKVLVPPSPGTLSAMGCVVADLRQDFVYTWNASSRQLDERELQQGFERLTERGQQWLAQETASGIELEHSYCLYRADMRYEGQAFDIDVPLDSTQYGRVQDAIDRFHRQYESVFGVSQPDAPVVFSHLRVTIVGVARKIHSLHVPAPTQSARAAETRRITFDGQSWDAHVIGRADLAGGRELQGPVIVEEYDTTVFVPPGYRVYGDPYGNIIGEATE